MPDEPSPSQGDIVIPIPEANLSTLEIGEILGVRFVDRVPTSFGNRHQRRAEARRG